MSTQHILTAAMARIRPEVETAATPDQARKFVEALARKHLEGNASATMEKDDDTTILVKANMQTNSKVQFIVSLGSDGQVYVDMLDGIETPDMDGWFDADHSGYIKGKKSAEDLVKRANREQSDIETAIDEVRAYGQDYQSMTNFLVALNKEYAKAKGK